jgi:hypothetical protein
MKIDLKNAYSDFTQESLFQTVCEENLGDASDYNQEQIVAAKEAFGTCKDVASLASTYQ